MEDLTDQEIAILVQSGNIEYFGILIKRYEEKMFRYSRKFLSQHQDIQDTVQEIFLKVYKNIQSFDTKREFSPWIYRIAHNELVNALKKKKRNPFFLFDLDVFLPYFLNKTDDLEDKFDRKLAKEDLNRCLEKLELKHKEPIVLYYFEELNYQEIANILKIPVSTVGIRIKRAKEKIRRILKYE